MDREIKFRGKRKKDGSWIYGSMCLQEDLLFGDETVCILPSNACDSYDNYVVDKCTVGQYTGLKDTNGVEIYEGDTVIVSSYRHERKYEVKWYGGGFHYGEMYPLSYPCGNVRVVGNIHDNPEKIKEE